MGLTTGSAKPMSLPAAWRVVLPAPASWCGSSPSAKTIRLGGRGLKPLRYPEDVERSCTLWLAAARPGRET